MKVSNLINASGNRVANQFIITGVPATQSFDGVDMPSGSRFQSYDSIIVHKSTCGDVYLDKSTWNYSNTTSRHRGTFLEESTKNTKAKIESGEYKMVDLN
jgi:hypothetical protein